MFHIVSHVKPTEESEHFGEAEGAYATLFFPLVALAISTIAENYQWSAYAGIGIVLILVGNLLILKK